MLDFSSSIQTHTAVRLLFGHRLINRFPRDASSLLDMHQIINASYYTSITFRSTPAPNKKRQVKVHVSCVPATTEHPELLRSLT